MKCILRESIPGFEDGDVFYRKVWELKNGIVVCCDMEKFNNKYYFHWSKKEIINHFKKVDKNNNWFYKEQTREEIKEIIKGERK